MPPAMPSVVLGWSFKVGSNRVVPTEENLDALSWSQQITDRRRDTHCSRRLMPFLVQSPNPQLRHDPTRTSPALQLCRLPRLQLSPQIHAYEASDTAYDYDPLARTLIHIKADGW
jgi:hypothetical protein